MEGKRVRQCRETAIYPTTPCPSQRQHEPVELLTTRAREAEACCCGEISTNHVGEEQHKPQNVNTSTSPRSPSVNGVAYSFLTCD